MGFSTVKHDNVAPIFGPDGSVIAALSVSGPISRIPKQRLPYYAKLVCQAAKDIAASIDLSSVENGTGPKVKVAQGSRPGTLRQNVHRN